MAGDNLRGRLLEALSVIRDSPEACDYERAFSLIRVFLTHADENTRDPELDAAFANAGRAIFMRRPKDTSACQVPSNVDPGARLGA